jgi:hypothetical protein
LGSARKMYALKYDVASFKKEHASGVTGFWGLVIEVSCENRGFVIISFTKYV